MKSYLFVSLFFLMEKPGSLQPLTKGTAQGISTESLEISVFGNVVLADEENEAKSCSFNLPIENRFGRYIITNEKSVRGITAVKDEEMS